MKKFLAIVALAVVFTACNNESETSAADAEKATQDSIHRADSIKAEEAKAAAAAAADTLKTAADSTAKKDSLKK